MNTSVPKSIAPSFPIIRRGGRLIRLVPELPNASPPKHKPSKHGETRAEAIRRGRLPAFIPQPALREIPLEQVRGDRDLVAAWRVLKRLPSKRADIVCALWCILENTSAADVRQIEALPPLRAGLDLTPWLMDRDALSLLLRHLDPDARTLDPRALAMWGEEWELRDLLFSNVFAETWLPFVSGGGMEVARELQYIAESMGTIRRPGVLALGAELLRLVTSPRALDWLRLIAEETEPRQELMLAVLVSSGQAASIDVNKAVRSLIRSIRHGQDRGVRAFEDELRFALRGFSVGASACYLRHGIGLARRLKLGLPGQVYAGSACPPKRLEALVVAHISPRRAIELWTACGKMPRLVALLEDLEPKRYRRRDVSCFINFLMDGDLAPDREVGRRSSRTWEHLAPLADDLRVHYFAKPISERADFLGFLECVRDSPVLATNKSLREEYLRLASVLCRRFKEAGESAKALRILLRAAYDAGRMEELRFLPGSSWGKLVKTCRSTNRGWLLEQGLIRIGRTDFATLLDGFESFPARTMELARSFGTPSRELSRRVMAVYSAHPLVGIDVSALPLGEALSLVDGVASFRAGAGVPVALRKHHTGGAPLRVDRLEHYREELFENAARLRLEVLDELLEAELKRSMLGDASAPLPIHTVLMAHDVDGNERALRGYLRRRVWDGADVRLEHPKNAQWIARQRAKFDVDAWLGSLEGETCLSSFGPVVLALESDPDEVLRMGSYVGSCLGLGGAFSHSAVAALLDANKRVIYARNRRRRVIGRQLVAVSAEGRLVCFDVYGNTTAEVQHAFRAFDQTLAESLGLPIECRYQGYKIETLVASEWYDDCAWDLQVEA